MSGGEGEPYQSPLTTVQIFKEQETGVRYFMLAL